MACEPETDLENAGQFSSIIPPGMHAAVQSYLLAKIRGGSMDVNEIIQDAACHTSCIPPGLLPRIKTWLLCQLSNTGGETPIPPYPECDADAQAFLTEAGITDETVSGAICVLVRDLKTYPAVGTKYWDRELLIYPFVGGTAASHAINLKNPTGLNNLVFSGGGFTHNALGVKGNGVSSFANTKFLIPSLNSTRAMAYVNAKQTIAGRILFGCVTVGNYFLQGTAASFAFRVNSGATTTLAGTSTLGAWFIQRYNAASQLGVYGSNAWTAGAVVSAAIPTRYLYLFANDDGGAIPQGNATSLSDVTMSGFSCGDPLDTGGGNTEHLEYKGIWDKFHNTLGRGHP